MAHETSAPNIGTILKVAAICVVSLIGIDLGLKSYYIVMFEDEEQAKVLHVPPVQLNKLREAEQQRLGAGAMPIDKAMRDLAARGLDNGTPRKVGGVDFTPEPSNDPAAMIGWAQLAKDAGPQAAPVLPVPAMATVDAGAMMAGDGGAMMMMTAEGGTGVSMAMVSDAGAMHAPAMDAGH